MTKDAEQKPDYLGHRKRVRDKFLAGGGRDMADYEFLELLLMMSIPRRDVKPIAKNLIRKFGSFADVINAETEELLSCEGIKETSAALLKAVREGAVRMQYQTLKASDQPIINSMDIMIDYFRSSMAYEGVEQFRIVYLDTKLRLIGEEVQQRGTINSVSLHPREVIKSAINRGAGAIIMVHNHPSGDVTPSHADIEITNKIDAACKAVNIRLIDHLIISRNSIYSFSQKGTVY